MGGRHQTSSRTLRYERLHSARVACEYNYTFSVTTALMTMHILTAWHGARDGIVPDIKKASSLGRSIARAGALHVALRQL